MAKTVTLPDGTTREYPITVEMMDGRQVTFDEDYDLDAMRKYRDTYNAKIKEGTFTRPGESATEPEDVSTAGLEMRTPEGANMFLRNLAQIPTAGFADELEAGFKSGAQSMGYGMGMADQPGDYMTEKAQLQGQQRAYEQTVGGSAGGEQTFGSLYAPTSLMTPSKGFGETMARAFGGGFGLGVGMSDENEFMSGLEGGAMSSAMTLPGYLLFSGFSKIKQLNDRAKNVKAEIKEIDDQVTLAYRNANESGENITNQEAQSIINQIKGDIRSQTDDSMTFANGTIQYLDNRLNKYKESNSNMEWEDLDQIRKDLWTRWKSASKNNRYEDANAIVDSIRNLDRYIDAVPNKGAQFALARNLWKQKQQATILDNMLERSKRRTAVTGSGGNQANNTVKVIEKILNDDKLNQFYTAEQLKAMDTVIKNFGSAKLSRALSKLDPSGNALMLFLQAYGAMAIDPTVLGSAIVGNYMNRRVNKMVQQDMDKLFYEDILKKDPVKAKPGNIPTTIGVTQSAEGQPGEQGIMDLLGVQQGYNFAP